MKELIEIVWKNRELLKESKYSKAIKSTVGKLDSGKIKVAEKINEKWVVNEWIKKAVVLYLSLIHI